jgi:hypothetical protein
VLRVDRVCESLGVLRVDRVCESLGVLRVASCCYQSMQSIAGDLYRDWARARPVPQRARQNDPAERAIRLLGVVTPK